MPSQLPATAALCQQREANGEEVGEAKARAHKGGKSHTAPVWLSRTRAKTTATARLVQHHLSVYLASSRLFPESGRKVAPSFRLDSQTGKETQLRSQVNNKICEIIISKRAPRPGSKVFPRSCKTGSSLAILIYTATCFGRLFKSVPLVPIVWMTTLCSYCYCCTTVVTPDVPEFLRQEVFRDDRDILSQVVVPDPLHSESTDVRQSGSSINLRSVYDTGSSFSSVVSL